jgi:hypothetical protein
MDWNGMEIIAGQQLLVLCRKTLKTKIHYPEIDFFNGKLIPVLKNLGQAIVFHIKLSYNPIISCPYRDDRGAHV